MIIHNTTFSVPILKASEWVFWLRNEQLPLLRENHTVKDIRLHKVLIDQQETITFALQIFLINNSNLEVFKENTLTLFMERINFKFNTTVLYFHTTLEDIPLN